MKIPNKQIYITTSDTATIPTKPFDMKVLARERENARGKTVST